MRTTSRVAVIAAVMLSLSPRVYAPIYGTYPGLRSLIKESDVIAAATVLEALPEVDLGGGQRYKIEFIKVLKGSPPQKPAIAWLRPLEIRPEAELRRSSPPAPTRYFAPTDDLFRPGFRYVLFLVKSERDDDTPYENVNCEGSSFPISPFSDLGQLKVESLSDTLILLFREYVEFNHRKMKELEQQLKAFIHEGDK